MYHSILKKCQMELPEKKIVVAMLYEAKIEDKEIFRLLKKYCNIDNEEALGLL